MVLPENISTLIKSNLKYQQILKKYKHNRRKELFNKICFLFLFFSFLALIIFYSIYVLSIPASASTPTEVVDTLLIENWSDAKGSIDYNIDLNLEYQNKTIVCTMAGKKYGFSDIGNEGLKLVETNEEFINLDYQDAGYNFYEFWSVWYLPTTNLSLENATLRQTETLDSYGYSQFVHNMAINCYAMNTDNLDLNDIRIRNNNDNIQSFGLDMTNETNNFIDFFFGFNDNATTARTITNNTGNGDDYADFISNYSYYDEFWKANNLTSYKLILAGTNDTYSSLDSFKHSVNISFEYVSPSELPINDELLPDDYVFSYDVIKNNSTIATNQTYLRFYLKEFDFNSDNLTINFNLPDNLVSDFENGYLNIPLYDNDYNFKYLLNTSTILINSTNFPTNDIALTLSSSTFSDLSATSSSCFHLKVEGQANLNVFLSKTLGVCLYSGDMPYGVSNDVYTDTELFTLTKSVWRKKLIFSTFMSIYDGFNQYYLDVQNNPATNIDMSINVLDTETDLLDFPDDENQSLHNIIYDLSTYSIILLFFIYIVWRVRNSFGSHDI